MWTKGHRKRLREIVGLVDLPVLGRPVRLRWRETALDVPEPAVWARVVRRTGPGDWSGTCVVDIEGRSLGDHPGGPVWVALSMRSLQNLGVGGIR